MTNLEQTLMKELSSLPPARLPDVIAFVRYLKLSLPDDEQARTEFKEALKDARKTARKHKITQDDIESEIRAVRGGK